MQPVQGLAGSGNNWVPGGVVRGEYALTKKAKGGETRELYVEAAINGLFGFGDSGDPAQAEKLAKLPIWAFHGAADPLVPVERPRDMIAAIKKAGGEPKYTEHKGVGHDAWTPTYRDNKVLDWLFEQKKGK